MEKYLAPEPIREGELPEQWLWFKREFNQFLMAVGKADATSAVKTAIFLRVVGIPRVKVGMDLFKCKGKDYLVIVDYLTDFFEISELSDTTSATVIKATKKEFTRHGVPLMVQSDGGQQFTFSEFQSFAKTWEFQHTSSSPYNSRSNGKRNQQLRLQNVY